MPDTFTKIIRGASDKLFNWSDDDRKAAAANATQRAKELQSTQAGPRLAKADLSGKIADLEDTAAYHLSKVGQSKNQSSGNISKKRYSKKHRKSHGK